MKLVAFLEGILEGDNPYAIVVSAICIYLFIKIEFDALGAGIL